MPRENIKLEVWKDQIKQWLSEGQTNDEIRRNLWREGGIQVSERTLRGRIRGWGIHVKQPYLSGDMTALRRRITEIFNEGRFTDSEAVQTLKNDGFNISARTYSKMRKEMGLYKRSQPGFRALATENTTTQEGG